MTFIFLPAMSFGSFTRSMRALGFYSAISRVVLRRQTSVIEVVEEFSRISKFNYVIVLGSSPNVVHNLIGTL